MPGLLRVVSSGEDDEALARLDQATRDVEALASTLRQELARTEPRTPEIFDLPLAREVQVDVAP